MRGVVPLLMPAGKTTEERVAIILDRVKAIGAAKPGDAIPVLHGQAGTTNLIYIAHVPGEGAPADAVPLEAVGRTYCQAPLSLPRSMAKFNFSESTSDHLSRKCRIVCTMG